MPVGFLTFVEFQSRTTWQ